MTMKEERAADAGAAVADGVWASVQSLDDFAELRTGRPDSSPHWWPEIGPVGDPGSFSFTHRMRRAGPITVLDADFHDDVWVNGGEMRPHYHVTLPVSPTSAASVDEVSVAAEPGSVAVYRPEGRAGVDRYVGRLLAVMIDRHAVEDALADSLGRSIASQIDFAPLMRTAAPTVRSWITLVSEFSEQLFRPHSVLNQPMVGMPFAEGLIRGLLLAADHPYRAGLEGEAAEPPPGAIRRAIEIIEAEADQPLTVAALARRSHVGVRSLQHGFQRHVGVTPMAYLRQVRLRRAHQALLESDPSTVTVASVAYRWGFTNLGRFAAAHTARYQEPPLKTLQRTVRSRGPSPVPRDVPQLRDDRRGSDRPSLLVHKLRPEHR
ncbi:MULTISPECIES: AraC family transcriptional regulator [Mycobacterium]|uniref:AraC family transcriptional regulator n=1 Tax=Mycobacterium TaxID=1763 RepID=UPI00044B6DDF|nr:MULTISPECIES: AraC family transcriptional regulator [Mycobacterium]ASW87015.1 AraC family transcriptional regulator [Mycobacterium intracellulare]EUA28211.1 bacterial regulatory helix-turn-helix s, AraC family protein [Mycobacterium intracellulare]UQB91508.1 AraC family transcriptional regulator [Mycobacterium intracellulare]WSE47800.1 AraC family transcriptional regulator [Mycobacterium sp. 3-98]